MWYYFLLIDKICCDLCAVSKMPVWSSELAWLHQFLYKGRRRRRRMRMRRRRITVPQGLCTCASVWYVVVVRQPPARIHLKSIISEGRKDFYFKTKGWTKEDLWLKWILFLKKKTKKIGKWNRIKEKEWERKKKSK